MSDEGGQKADFGGKLRVVVPDGAPRSAASRSDEGKRISQSLTTPRPLSSRQKSLDALVRPLSAGSRSSSARSLSDPVQPSLDNISDSVAIDAKTGLEQIEEKTAAKETGHEHVSYFALLQSDCQWYHFEEATSNLWVKLSPELYNSCAVLFESPQYYQG